MAKARVADPKSEPLMTNIEPCAIPELGRSLGVLLAAFATDVITGALAWAARY